MDIPKVSSLESPSSGNPVPNQFVIDCGRKVYFQSYETIIACVDRKTGQVTLDKDKWNYSVTTSKYRNIFLRETTKETKNKINKKQYKLVNLNKG